MSFFKRISTLIATKGNRLHIEIVGIEDGQIRVRVTPDLGAVPENASTEEAELRALLSIPLTLVGTPEEVDQLLEQHINQRAEPQAVGLAALSNLTEKMTAAADKAASAKPAASTAGKSAKKVAATDTATDTVTAKAPVSEAPAKAPTLDSSF